MPASPVNPDDERVLERFKPTTGLFVGVVGLLIAAFTLGYVVLSVHTTVGLRLGLGAVFGAVVVWVSQLRPRVTAYTRDLHLKGSLRDARVPYVLIDEVVDQAKRELRRRGQSTEGLAVTRPYAVPEIVALTVTGVAFVVSLLV